MLKSLENSKNTLLSSVQRKAPALETKTMAAESLFAEVSDEYLNSLLHKSIPKSTLSTKYGMKIFNGRNAQNEFELLKNLTANYK